LSGCVEFRGHYFPRGQLAAQKRSVAEIPSPALRATVFCSLQKKGRRAKAVLEELRAEVSIQRQAAVDEARTWIGTPYQLNGAEKGVGVDCQHLIVAVYRAVGLPMPSGGLRRTAPIGGPRCASWVEAVEAYRDAPIGLDRVAGFINEIETPQPGDTALFGFWGTYVHAGIVVRWPAEVIHAVRFVSAGDVSAGMFSRRPMKFLSPKSWS
jgi:cell wall-associated NlpC family hydrolase